MTLASKLMIRQGMDSSAIELKISYGIVRRSCQTANDVVPTQ